MPDEVRAADSHVACRNSFGYRYHGPENQWYAQMNSKAFDHDDWIDRLAGALAALAKAQKPYLQAYWRHNPRKYVIVNGRDETPFPLDDVRMVYAMTRHSGTFVIETRLETQQYAPLRAALDPTRHALLSHPTLERVAVTGRLIGENDFSLRILNSGTAISAGDLIAGLMARAAELSNDGFRTAAGELNAFLSPVAEGEASGVLGNLDEGCDALLFYGLSVSERIDLDDSMAILPSGEVRRFVEQELVKELAPTGARFHGWRSLGAVVRPFRWRPVFRRKVSMNEPTRGPTWPFFTQARTFLDLLAVSHATPLLPLAEISNCIDRSAARLLGQETHNARVDQKKPAGDFGLFFNCPVLKTAALDEAREAFSNRDSARYQKMAPFVTQLAEALGRAGRVALHDKILDVAIALEGMYELPDRKKSRNLQERVSSFLETDAEVQRRVQESIKTLYASRSDIVHSGSVEESPSRKGAAFTTGFDLARRSLFKLLREGPPDDWGDPAGTRE